MGLLKPLSSFNDPNGIELPRLHSRKAIDRRCIVFDFVVGEFLLAVALVVGSQLLSVMLKF